jgi:outer membrane protein TolC
MTVMTMMRGRNAKVLATGALAAILMASSMAGAQVSDPAVPAAQPAAAGASGAAANQPIDLPTTLRLAGANNLDLALIRQALVQAEAQNDAATLGFFPWLSGGFGYTKHSGAIQDVSGNVFDAYKQLHSTAGGVTAQVNLGDAIFQKLATSRLKSAAEYSVDAGRNATILAAASAYFELVSALSNVKIAEEALRISKSYEDQLNRAVGIGMANKSDALRVGVQTQNYEIVLRRARETVRTASAKLATVLHLDPTNPLQPVDQMVPQVTLIPQDAQLDPLVRDAFANRPELKASAETVEAADWQKSQSIYGPLVPSVGAQALYGNIDGGPRGLPSNSGGTRDYALMFNWRVGPGGLLDFSRIDLAESKLEQGKINDAKLHDLVAQQVVQAYEGMHSAFDQLSLTRKSVDLAEQSLKLSQGRQEFGVAAVLEVIQAQKDLTDARANYVRALTQYAEFQYALAQAVGRIGE